MPENSRKINEDEISLEVVKNAFDNVEESARTIHEKFVDAAQYAGYISDTLEHLRPIYTNLAERLNEDKDLATLVVSGTNSIISLNNELKSLGEEAQFVVRGTFQVAGSTNTFVSSSSAAASMSSLETVDTQIFEPPTFLTTDDSKYAEMFDRLDPALGKTYRAIFETYYGTVSDPVRAAMALIRQSFDHFFDILAPNDKVRESEYWTPKEGNEPDKIYRRERMEYAIRTHISNETRGDTLISNLDLILKNYGFLNNLHKRGELNKEKSRTALWSIKRFLEDFIDSI